jgi:predicted DNA-binding transcriptional regulator AlpA
MKDHKTVCNEKKTVTMPIEEVMDVTGRKTRAAIRQLVWRRKIPHKKIAGKVVFLRHEIEEWLASAPGLTLEQLKKGA